MRPCKHLLSTALTIYLAVGFLFPAAGASKQPEVVSHIGIREIEVYGPDDPTVNLALGARVRSEGEIPRPYVKPLSFIVDGRLYTRWSNYVRVPGTWIELDLGSDRRIDRVVVRPMRNLITRYVLTLAPDGDMDAARVIARSGVDQPPTIDTTLNGTWINVDEEGRPIPEVGRYLRLEILSGSDVVYEVILDPEEIYRIEDFHYESKHLLLDLKEGILVPGMTAVGVTVVIVLGEGRYAITPPRPGELSPALRNIRNIRRKLGDIWIDRPVSGRFSYLYMRINPKRYDELFGSSLKGKIEDMEGFARAKRIYSLLFSKSYHANEFAIIPSAENFGVALYAVELGRNIMIGEGIGEGEIGEGEYYFAIECPEPIETPEYSLADVLHYDIQARIRPDEHSLSARSIITLKGVDQDKGWIGLMLRKDLGVEEVTDRGGNPLEYLLAPISIYKRRLYIRTAPVPSRGDTIQLVVEYSGKVLADSTEHRIWDYIGPEGSYLRPEAFWYPRNPGDPATARMAFTVPGSLTVVSNGALEWAHREGEERTFRWAVDQPVGGLAFTAARYLKEERAGDGFVLQSYLFPQDAGRAEEYLDRSEGIISFYSERFGPYPFHKFAIVEIPQGYRGGHGDQSFVMMYEGAFKPPFDEKLWAHEIAHQWWGNWVGIVFGYGDWLSEGLAEYSALLFIEHKRGREAFLKGLGEIAYRYLSWEGMGREDEPPLRGADDRVVAYNKGAYFFHMLRYILGEEGFFRALRQLTRDYGGGQIDPFRLQEVCETVYGKDLDWFFGQWLDQPGVPQYELTWKLKEGPQGVWRVKGTIRQVRGDFRMPLEVVAVTEGGRYIRRIWVEGRKADFSFDLESRPLEVLLDPDRWVLRQTPQTLASAEVNRHMRAGEELWNQGDHSGAREEFQKALALGPEGRVLGRLLHDLGRVEFKLGQTEAAFEHLRQALPLLPQNHWTTAWTRNTLGEIYLKRGEYEKARREYEAVVAMQATVNSVKHARRRLNELAESRGSR